MKKVTYLKKFGFKRFALDKEPPPAAHWVKKALKSVAKTKTTKNHQKIAQTITSEIIIEILTEILTEIAPEIQRHPTKDGLKNL